MNFQGALNSLPKNGNLHGKNLSDIFHSINHICISAPQFYDKELTGIPFYALMVDILDTSFGQTLFSNPIINCHLKQIYDDYHIMLSSEKSL